MIEKVICYIYSVSHIIIITIILTVLHMCKSDRNVNDEIAKRAKHNYTHKSYVDSWKHWRWPD